MNGNSSIFQEIYDTSTYPHMILRTLLHNSKAAVMTLTRKEAEAQVKSWGYPHVFTWTDSP